MGMNPLELLFRIAGDPSPLKQALDQSQADVTAATAQITQTVSQEAAKQVEVVNTTQEAMRRTVAESLRMQGASASQATEIYKQLGLAGEQAAREIGAAFGAAATETGKESVAVNDLDKMVKQLAESAAQAQAKLAAMKANPDLVASIREANQEMRQLSATGTQSLTATRLQAQLLSNELGLRLPRSITALIGQSGVLSQALSAAFPILIAGFFIEEVIKIDHAIAHAAEQVMGYTGEVKKAYEQDVKASEEAVRHFTTVAEGNERIAQTTRELGEIAEQTFTSRYIRGLKQADEETSILWGFLREGVVLYRGLGDSAAKAANEQVIAIERLRAQSEQMISVLEEQTKHEEKMLDLQTKVSGAGKGRVDQIQAELGALEQKRQLQLRIASEEAGIEALSNKAGGDKAAIEKRKADEINAEIELQKKLLEGELEGAKLKVKDAVDYAGQIERQNVLLRERIALESAGDQGAHEQAVLAAQREIDAQDKVLKSAESALAHKKITRAEMAATEKAYADAVVLINQELQNKLYAIDAKQTESFNQAMARMAQKTATIEAHAQQDSSAIIASETTTALATAALERDRQISQATTEEQRVAATQQYSEKRIAILQHEREEIDKTREGAGEQLSREVLVMDERTTAVISHAQAERNAVIQGQADTAIAEAKSEADRKTTLARTEAERLQIVRDYNAQLVAITETESEQLGAAAQSEKVKKIAAASEAAVAGLAIERAGALALEGTEEERKQIIERYAGQIKAIRQKGLVDISAEQEAESAAASQSESTMVRHTATVQSHADAELIAKVTAKQNASLASESIDRERLTALASTQAERVRIIQESNARILDIRAAARAELTKDSEAGSAALAADSARMDVHESAVRAHAEAEKDVVIRASTEAALSQAATDRDKLLELASTESERIRIIQESRAKILAIRAAAKAEMVNDAGAAAPKTTEEPRTTAPVLVSTPATIKSSAPAPVPVPEVAPSDSAKKAAIAEQSDIALAEAKAEEERKAALAANSAERLEIVKNYNAQVLAITQEQVQKTKALEGEHQKVVIASAEAERKAVVDAQTNIALEELTSQTERRLTLSISEEQRLQIIKESNALRAAIIESAAGDEKAVRISAAKDAEVAEANIERDKLLKLAATEAERRQVIEATAAQIKAIRQSEIAEIDKEVDARQKPARAAVANADKIVAAADKELRAEIAKAQEANASEIGKTLIRNEAHIKEIQAKAAERAATIEWAETEAKANHEVMASELELAKSRLDEAKTDPTADAGKIAQLTTLVEEMKRREAAAYALVAQASRAYGLASQSAAQNVTAAMRQEEGETDKAVAKIVESLKKKSEEEERSYESIKMPGSQAILQLGRELAAIKQRDEAVKASVATARTEAAELMADVKNKRDLAAATKDATQQTQLLNQAKKEEKQATDLLAQSDRAEAQARRDANMADAEAVANAASGLLTVLGYKKAAAYVDMVIQTAEGIAQVAAALDPYDPAHAQHAISAATHFMSAAEYGIIAGQASKTSAGANVGGGSGGQAGGSPGPLAAGATGSQTPMQPGLTSIGGMPTTGQPSGTLHVMVVGPSDAAQWMATQLNNLTQRQGGQLVASRAIQPPRAGR